MEGRIKTKNKKTNRKKLCRVAPYKSKKYQSRKGPPVPAKKCKNRKMKGNDGKMYISEKRKRAQYFRWYQI